MTHWDYRVFFDDDGYTIRTVYYDDEGTIVACSEKPIEPFGESLEDLQKELNLLQIAVTKKVLSASDIPTQTLRPKVKRGKSLAAVRQQLGLQPEVVKEGSLTQKIKAMKMTEKIRVQASSSNVFADLGLENADELLVKAELAHKISSIITKQKMTQSEAAELLEIDQVKVSELIKGKLSSFSTVQMFQFLNSLDRDVEIVVKSKPKSRLKAQTRVVSA